MASSTRTVSLPQRWVISVQEAVEYSHVKDGCIDAVMFKFKDCFFCISLNLVLGNVAK